MYILQDRKKCIALETYLQVTDAANVALLNGPSSDKILSWRKTKLRALMQVRVNGSTHDGFSKCIYIYIHYIYEPGHSKLWFSPSFYNVFVVLLFLYNKKHCFA